MTVGVETRTEIGRLRLAPSQAEAQRTLAGFRGATERLGGRRSGINAGGGAPCPEPRGLKALPTCLSAGFHPPAAGPMPVTAVESQTERPLMQTAPNLKTEISAIRGMTNEDWGDLAPTGRVALQLCKIPISDLVDKIENDALPKTSEFLPQMVAAQQKFAAMADILSAGIRRVTAALEVAGKL